MPYKDKTANRLAARERQRQHRAKLKAAKAMSPVVALPVAALPDDPIAELATWAAKRPSLKIPPGHPLSRSSDGAS